MIPPIRVLLLGAVISNLASFGLAEGPCRKIVPIGNPPYTAESYPLPLSLRINLTLLLKQELHRIDRYGASTEDAVFTTLLESELRKLQRERAEEETGCTTWEIVTALDRLGRLPPSSDLQ